MRVCVVGAASAGLAAAAALADGGVEALIVRVALRGVAVLAGTRASGTTRG